MPSHASSAFQPPVIVLVRPQLAENIGATARAMVNFGGRDLRLVAPREFDQALAERMACDGRDIFLRRQVYPDLASAPADCAYALATSRRLRRVKIPPLDPRAAAERLAALPPSSRKALVFGSEQAGLTNEELFLCDAASTIPVTEQGSLNLAQAVVVYCYEWFTASRQARPLPYTPERPATHEEKQRIYDLLSSLLLAADYQPRSRFPEFLRRVKLLFENRLLTHREQRILLKVLRYLEKGIAVKPPGRSPGHH
ncbi:MAG: RNA methyltransferase [candidate division FCPU426 bacterium]